MPRLATATVRPLLALLFCSLSLQKAHAAAPADSARVLESQGEFALALAAYEAISVRAGDDSTVTDAVAREALRARLRLYVRLRNDVAADALLRQHASQFEPESREDHQEAEDPKTGFLVENLYAFQSALIAGQKRKPSV